MVKPTTLLAFAASNSTTSINKRLAEHAAAVFKAELQPDVTIETLDLNDFEMPIFSPAREAAGIPQEARDFLEAIGRADGLIISFPEHNGTYSAAFKNLFDWASRVNKNVYQDKPTLVMATSGGARGAQNVLKVATEGLPHFGAKVTSTFNFGPFADHFDDDGLKTPELKSKLKEALVALSEALTA